jgi:hypothetical protein
MFNVSQKISSGEHRLVAAVLALGFTLRLIESALALIYPETKGASFGIYDIFDMWDKVSPIYSFIVFAVSLIACWKISIPSVTCSLLPIALLTFFFDRWFLDSRHTISIAAKVNPDYQFKTFDFALLNGSIYDFVSLIVVNIAFLWLFSILIRLLNRNVTLA